MPHIAQMLERNARRTPEREALIYRDRRLNGLGLPYMLTGSMAS